MKRRFFTGVVSSASAMQEVSHAIDEACRQLTIETGDPGPRRAAAACVFQFYDMGGLSRPRVIAAGKAAAQAVIDRKRFSPAALARRSS
jgi:hypothetical protein